jgi:hypothetical protein
MKQNAVIVIVVALVAGAAAAWALAGGSARAPERADGDRQSARPAVAGRPVPAANCTEAPPPGLLGRRSHWDITVGPLSFLDAAEGAREPASVFRPRGGSHRVWKAPVALQPGHVATVRLVSPAGRAALDYHSGFGGVGRVSDGERAATFRACPRAAPRSARGAPTTWAGGIVVSGPQCVVLEVFADERTTSQRVWMGIGDRRCRAR